LPGREGTGSHPPGFHGLHLNIRVVVSQIPLRKPCLIREIREYSLQVGKNRHEGGIRGLMNIWYPRMRYEASFPKNRLTDLTLLPSLSRYRAKYPRGGTLQLYLLHR